MLHTLWPELILLSPVPSGGNRLSSVTCPDYYSTLNKPFSADAEGAVKCHHYKALANGEFRSQTGLSVVRNGPASGSPPILAPVIYSQSLPSAVL